MTKISVLFISWFLAAFSYKAMAQEDGNRTDKKTGEHKKSQEIVIRKKGDKDINLTIQITGDKVMINGKPLVEFNDENITINKRLFHVFDGHNMAGLQGMENFELENFAWNFEGDSKVMLGVTTDRADDGAKISKLTKGSAAEKAGLMVGDVITMFGETKIEDAQDLYDAVNEKKAKDEVKITYKRDGKVKVAKAIIEQRANETFAMTAPNGTYKSYTIPRTRIGEGAKRLPNAKVYATPDVNIEREIQGAMDYAYAFGRPKLGLKIQDTDDEKGVKVLSIEENSASAKAGLKADDVITEIGGKKIMNTDDAREALHDNEKTSAYKIKARRGNTDMNFDIKIQKKLKTTNL